MARPDTIWYPTILPERCDGCNRFRTPKCVDYCPHSVFELRDGKAVVSNPQNCVYGCVACESVCPRKAIVFPQYRAITSTIKCRDKDLLHKVKCRICGKVFWTNRDVNLCFECEEESKA